MVSIKNIKNNIKSVIKFGWNGFSRNKILSLQVIFIMAVVVLTFVSLFLFGGLVKHLISEIEKRVDVVVSFNKEANEEEILALKQELYDFSKEIENIDYVSRERALEVFKERHINEPIYERALAELQENPLPASLNIKASSLSCYSDVAAYLQDQKFGNLVSKVSYNDVTHRQAIEKMVSINAGVEKAGLAISIVFGLLVVLITFNTIKLTIFSFRDEITTMRLVGSSNLFIQGPFIIQSIICGVFAVVASNILLFFSIFYINDKINSWVLQFNLLNYLQNNLLFLVSVELGIVAILGLFSTLLATRKYLKV